MEFSKHGFICICFFQDGIAVDEFGLPQIPSQTH